MVSVSIERINKLNSETAVEIILPCRSLEGSYSKFENLNREDLTHRLWGTTDAWLTKSEIRFGEFCFNIQMEARRTRERDDANLLNIPSDSINRDEDANKYPILKKYNMPWKQMKPHHVWSAAVNPDICYYMDVGLIPDEQFYCSTNHLNIKIPKSQWTFEMDEKSLEEFVEAMDTLIDHELVNQHHRLSELEAHSFFFAHRNYLACIKKRLALHGIGLPIWSPETPIPLVLQGVKRSPRACLSSPACENGWFDFPFRTTNTDLLTIPTQLRPDQLCNNYAGDFQKLFIAAFSYHANVHVILGGAFNHRDAAGAPLLYVFHNWIDIEIFSRWENCP
jgi:hypothetical protein